MLKRKVRNKFSLISKILSSPYLKFIIKFLNDETLESKISIQKMCGEL